MGGHHPQRANYFVSSWQISLKKNWLLPQREDYFVSWWHRKINCPHPPTSKSRGLVVTNFNWKKSCPHPPTSKSRGLVVTNSNNIKMLKPLQITPCRIGLPWPYVVGFSAQLYDGMYKCHQLTYNALSDPHSHCFQWFPRLGGPRGKHPWLTKESYIQSAGTRITVTHWVKLVTIRIFQPTQNFCTILKTCPLLYILSPKLTACVIWQ